MATPLQALVKAPRRALPAVVACLAHVTTEHPRPALSGDPDEYEWIDGACAPASADHVAQQLQDLVQNGAPEHALPPTPLAFMIWEDPDGEWLGDLIVYVPTADPAAPLVYRADCDATGAAVLGHEEVFAVLDTATSLSAARAHLRELLGLDAIAAYRRWAPADDEPEGSGTARKP